MSFDYGQAATDARALLADFGRPGTFTRPVVTGGDPADPAAGTESVISFEALVAVLPIPSNMVGMGAGETVIRDTDVRIYAGAGLPYDPQANDTLETVAGSWRVLSVSIFAPAGVTVLYEIVARA